MSDELKDYEEEINDLIAEIRKGIDGLAKIKSPPEKQNKITFLKSRLNRLKDVHKSFKIELRDIPKTSVEKNTYEKKGKEFADSINQLIKDLDWVQERADLIGDSKPQDLDGMTTDDILNKAQRTQQQTVDTVDRIIKQVDETKNIGAETTQKLKEQTEQLARAEDGLNEIDDNLKLASKQLRSFARRVMTDKLILGFACLLVLAIIFIIIWEAIKNHSSGTPTPPPLLPSTTAAATT